MEWQGIHLAGHTQVQSTNTKDMLIIKKEVVNNSGVRYPSGMLVAYRHHTDADQRTVRTEFNVWLNIDSFQKKMQPLVCSSIGIFKDGVGDRPISTLSMDDAPELNAPDWDSVFDGLAIAGLLTITHDLSIDDIEKVAQKPLYV